MRILIHGINFSPELVGIGRYTGELGAWLAGRGHEVRVVTAPPYYPEWRVDEHYSAWRYRKERLSAAPPAMPRHGRNEGNPMVVYRCPLWVPARPNGWKRLLHLTSFAAGSFPAVMLQSFWRPHLVLLIAPTLFCTPQSRLIARWSGARSWLHIQDFEVDAAFSLGILGHPRLRAFTLGVERRLLRGFDRISTISEGMLERLQQKGVDSRRCVLFPNWVDTAAVHPLPFQSRFCEELDLDKDAVAVLYAGTMGEKQGLENLIGAARLLQAHEHIIFILCGEGGARARLVSSAAGLANIRWLPLQPAERLNELLNLADVHVLPQRADAADLVMPSKLAGMLASGRPVIATAFPETEIGRVVLRCGVLVNPGDVHALADAVARLAGDPRRRDALGQAARRYAEECLDRDGILRAFEAEIERLSGAGREFPVTEGS